MPAKSEDQQQMMGIAYAHPEKLYARNRGVLKMKKTEKGRAALHEFAATKSKGLPARVKH